MKLLVGRSNAPKDANAITLKRHGIINGALQLHGSPSFPHKNRFLT